MFLLRHIQIRACFLCCLSPSILPYSTAKGECRRALSLNASKDAHGHRTGPWTTAASVNIMHVVAFLSLLSNAMLLAMLFAVKEERNKFFLGASPSTSVLSFSSLVNPFCCQGASCQLPVTFLAKRRANDSTMLINTLQGRCNESPMVDNDNN